MSAVTRPDLVRTLGDVVTAPPDAESARVLGLPPPTDRASHTAVFVLETHPYASVHLGAEGMIGGDAGDRVAGFWRALGLVPPAEPDHLAVLLALYARLGSEELAVPPTQGRRQVAIASARAALLWEHLAPWAPVHLAAVTRVGGAFHRGWARLAGRVLQAEAEALPERSELPTALAVAPPPVALGSRRDLVDGVLAPARSGMVVARADLARLGGNLGLGVRPGERRFVLDVLLDNTPEGVLAGLAAMAQEWAALHRSWHAGPLEVVGRWWAERARLASGVLAQAAHAVGGPSPAGASRG